MPGQFDDPLMTIFDPNTFQTRDIVAEYQQMKDQQDQALQAHKQFSDNLQEQQFQVQQKQTDLNVADRLYKVLDPSIAPSARKFLLNETAKYLGVDPKSPTFRDLSSMVSGLDPDTMVQLKSALGDQLSQASPGQVRQIVSGLMTGQVSFNDFLNQARTTMRAKSAAGEQPQATPTEGQPPKVATPFQPTSTAPVMSFEGQRTIPPNAAQASPQLVGALGLDSRIQYRNQDLQRQGFRIPFSAQDQEKLAGEITETSTGISSTLREAAVLNGLVTGHPEVLGTVGSAVDLVQSAVRQVQGALRVLDPAFRDESNPFSPELQKLSKDVTDQLQRANVIQVTAENAARVQAIMISLAYKMALAEGVPGNRLTNGIIQQHLAQLGHAASPDQFNAVLKDTIANTISTFDEHIRRQVGTSGNDIVSRQMTNDDIKLLASRADILPKPFAQSLLSEAQRRASGQGGPVSPAPMSPTIEEEQRTLGTLETTTKQRQVQGQEQEQQLQLIREQRAQRDEILRQSREERQTRVQEQQLQLSQDRYALELAREKRISEKDAHDQLTKAFQHFGAQIAARFNGAQVGVSGGGGGGGQNEGAFRIAPGRQRQAPAIPNIQIPNRLK